MALIRGFQFSCISILLARLFKLQVINNEKYLKRSDRNSKKVEFLLPKRGDILDINGDKIAKSIKETKVVFYKHRKDNDYLQEIKKVYSLISSKPKKLDLFLKKLEREIKRMKTGKFVIAKNLTKKDLYVLRYNLIYLPNVGVEEYYAREYPFYGSTSSLIGDVYHPHELNNSILRENKEFKIGHTGLEKQMNTELSGTIGLKYNIVNAVGEKVGEQISKRSIDGLDVKTTIDQRLQNILADLMKDKNGSCTLLDVNTGNILAMCSAPNIDPNFLAKGISQDQWMEVVGNNVRDNKGIFLNKNIASAYPPGSTFKIISSATALIEGLNPEQKFFCSGSYRIGNRIFHCWKKEGHGSVDLDKAIAQSCNCYFYHLSTQVSADKIYKTAREFGLGEKLLDDFNGEVSGNIPNVSWKEKIYKQPWFAGDNANFVVGQGYTSITPLQLATMTARLATGKKIIPHYIYNGDNYVYSDIKVDNRILEIIKKGLYSVINNPYGIAFGAVEKKYQICGKTGSAQVVSERIDNQDMRTGKVKKEKHSHALFVGFAPYNNPRFAVSVVVEHGIGGARTALPIASTLLKQAMLLYKVI